MKLSNCQFCRIDPGLILQEYEDFLLILDPFPLCFGHLMLVSRFHYGCSGEMPRETLAQLQKIALNIEHFLRMNFGSCIFYEHGRCGSCHSSHLQDCNHMHLHLLPLRINLHPKLTSDFLSIEVAHFEEIRRCFHGMGEYLFFRDSTGLAKFYSTAAVSIPSHFMRTLLAESLEKPELAFWENNVDQRSSFQSTQLRSFVNKWSLSDLPR